MHIKVDDTVLVLVGDDKGTRGKVLRMLRKSGKLVVEGVNRVYKHVKRSQKNPQGGRLSKEMPVQLSNVMFVCPSCSQASKTGAKVRADGSKARFCKKCKAEVGDLGPARAKAVAKK